MSSRLQGQNDNVFCPVSNVLFVQAQHRNSSFCVLVPKSSIGHTLMLSTLLKKRNEIDPLCETCHFFHFKQKQKTGTFQLITNVAKGTNNCSSFTGRRGHEFLASVVFIIKECCVAWKILRHLREACKWVLWEKIAPWVSHYHPRWIRPKSFFGIIRFSMQSLPRCSMMY